MPTPFKVLLLLAAIVLSSQAHAIEFFGKGSVSKNYLAVDNSTMSVSMTGGVALQLFSAIRLEARYTNISSLQDKLDVVAGTQLVTLSAIKTQTTIYSIGVDISFLSEKSWFQPFIYVGAGYIETERSYYVSLNDGGDTPLITEPKQQGVSANGGIGFRLRIANHLAIEVEAFAYATDIQKKNPLINVYGTAGVRIFI